MTPKFTIGHDDRLYLHDKYICNGHWLVTRYHVEYLPKQMVPKPIKDLTLYTKGVYPAGIKAGHQDDMEFPDFANVIPKRDGYTLLNPVPIGVEFRNETDIAAYVYQGDGFVIGIQPKYVPLLRMGKVFAKSATMPILILDGDTLNSELVGVVMPMRLEQNKKYGK